MLDQLLVGTLVIALSVFVHAVFVTLASVALKRVHAPPAVPFHQMGVLIILVAVTLWLIAGLSVSVWIWAAVFIRVGAFDSLEPAVYFSLTSLTTLGFGDIVLAEWRLLSGMAAANGLVLFGFSTAFLFEVIWKLRDR